ncbi:MAG TPA: S9 family peptidase [Kofleriaceae bacterium]|nr:S9 family peptidase [Kofleriaceae bacterium]
MSLPPLIPRALLFGDPEIRFPRISPDGTQLAYLAPHRGALSIWVRAIDAPGDRAGDRVIAHDPARGIRWFCWQGDSCGVLYLQDRLGDEHYHLFQAGLDGEPARDLTPGEQVTVLNVVVEPRSPGEVLVMTNQRDPSAFDVHRIDLAAGTSQLDTLNPGGVDLWLSDDRLVVRAARVRRDDGGSTILVRDDDAAPWRVLDEIDGDDGAPQLVSLSPAGDGMYVITAKGAEAERLVRYDLATGATTLVAADPRHDVKYVDLDPATREVLAVAILRDRLEWTAVDPAFADDLAAMSALHPGDLGIVSASADGATLIANYFSDVRPIAYCTYDRRTRRGHLMFYIQPALLDHTLAPMQPIELPARDGLALSGYLTLPVGLPARHLPTVLYVHGGPWFRDRWGLEPDVQWLANRGYAVLQVNFRGSTGYGKAFVNAGDREWAGAMRTDLLDARDWAIASGYADPRRFAIMGASYGGYAVLTALAFTPDAFCCGVDIVGPSNLATMLQSVPPYWKTLRATFARRMGDDPELLAAHSPLPRAAAIRAPLLIGHGANDPRVLRQESDQLVASLRDNGIPVRYIVFDDEGHGFMRPANALRFHAEAEAFLAEHLGGRAEPRHPDEEIEPFLR